MRTKNTFPPEGTEKTDKQYETAVLKTLGMRQRRTVTTESWETNKVSPVSVRITSRMKFPGCSQKAHPCHLPRLRRHKREPTEAKATAFCRAEYQREECCCPEKQPVPAEGLLGVFSWDLINTHVWGSYSRQIKSHLKGVEGILHGDHTGSRTVLFPIARVENLAIHRAGVDC